MMSVAEYIARRLKQLGADHLFCVPGNYSAEFLLAAQAVGIDCIGTTNELEAGYAADAYSRFKRIGVCSVTYGVGSQSLYNAIAGAYVEYCPVVLINGSPTLEKIENLRTRNILFAHAIDPLRTDRAIFSPVTVDAAEITRAGNAPEMIDRVLRQCITWHRPVYLEVHQGVWSAVCKSPQGTISPDPGAVGNPEDQDVATHRAVEELLVRIEAADRPVLWGGEMIQRLGLVDAFRSLVEISKLPYTTTLMGKGLIPETLYPEQFIGVYDSKFAPSSVVQAVEQSDCLIALGTILSDFYADIATKPDEDEKLQLAAGNAARVGGMLFPNVPLEKLLPRLVERFRERGLNRLAHCPLPGLSEIVQSRGGTTPADTSSEVPATLTWDSFFDRLRNFVKDDALVLTDTGLALFPSAELTIAREGGYLAQTAWLSIGYTCGAALGAALAQPTARPLVLVGDGGFQMIPQSLSTLVRQNVGALVFVFDNGLYGIEQFLVDEQILKKGERFYRDKLTQPSQFDVLPRWDYVRLAESFGAQGMAVTTLTELDDALKAVSKRTTVPTLIAVKLDPHDLPREIEAVVRRPRPDDALLEPVGDERCVSRGGEFAPEAFARNALEAAVATPVDPGEQPAIALRAFN